MQWKKPYLMSFKIVKVLLRLTLFIFSILFISRILFQQKSEEKHTKTIVEDKQSDRQLLELALIAHNNLFLQRGIKVYDDSLNLPLVGEIRRKGLKKLAKAMEVAISENQSGKECQSRGALICDINKHCGFGCQIHHLVYCLMTAISLDRVLLVWDYSWSYSSEGNNERFSDLFEAPSSCTLKDFVPAEDQQERWIHSRGGPRKIFPHYEMGRNDSNRILYLPIVEETRIPLNLLGQSMPFDDELQRSIRFYLGDESKNEATTIFYIGSLARYLLRERLSREKPRSQIQIESFPRTTDRFEDCKCRVAFHIRGTDKLELEAKEHDLWTEYYARALEWQRAHGMQNNPLCIYVATDDPKHLQEIKNAEKPSDNVTWYWAKGSASSASTTYRRTTQSHSIKYLLTDLRYLTGEASFVVCTFSSHFCRLAYELSLASQEVEFESLDESYYFN